MVQMAEEESEGEGRVVVEKNERGLAEGSLTRRAGTTCWRMNPCTYGAMI